MGSSWRRRWTRRRSRVTCSKRKSSAVCSAISDQSVSEEFEIGVDGGVGDAEGLGDLAEGLAGLAEFVSVEDSAAALWGGGHCSVALLFYSESSTGVGGWTDCRADDRRDWSGRVARGAPLCLRHLPPPSGGRGDPGGIFTHRVGGRDRGGICTRGSGGESGSRRRIRSADPRIRSADPRHSVGRSAGFGRPIPGFGRPIPGFGRPIPGFGRPIPGFGRPLLVADRGLRPSSPDEPSPDRRYCARNLAGPCPVTEGDLHA